MLHHTRPSEEYRREAALQGKHPASSPTKYRQGSDAVTYARVSVADKDEEKTSPDFQREKTKAYAEANGLDVTSHFSDLGYSGDDWNRPGLLEMIEFIEANPSVSAVVVLNQSRMARHPPLLESVSRVLRKLGVRLLFVEGVDDEVTPESQLMIDVQAAIDRFELLRIRRRAAQCAEAKTNAGEICFPAPFGYLNHREGRVTTLVPDPEKAGIVTRIFTDFLSGKAIREIMIELNLEGITSRKGNPIGDKLIRNILAREVYAGLLPDGRGGFVEALHESLIDRETFEKVQEILWRSPRPRMAKAGSHPLTRFVRCAKCGRNLTASVKTKGGRDYSYYHCPSGCPGGHLPARVLHGRMIALLSSLKLTERARGLLAEEISGRGVVGHVEETERRMRRLSHAARATLGRLERVKEDYLSGRLGASEYHTLTSECNSHYRKLMSERRRVRRVLRGGMTAVERLLAGRISLDCIWTRAPLEIKVQLQALIFPDGLEYDPSTGTFLPARISPEFEEGMKEV